MDEDTIAYFKKMAEEKGIPYQGLINFIFTRLCPISSRPEVTVAIISVVEQPKRNW